MDMSNQLPYMCISHNVQHVAQLQGICYCDTNVTWIRRWCHNLETIRFHFCYIFIHAQTSSRECGSWFSIAYNRFFCFWLRNKKTKGKRKNRSGSMSFYRPGAGLGRYYGVSAFAEPEIERRIRRRGRITDLMMADDVWRRKSSTVVCARRRLLGAAGSRRSRGEAPEVQWGRGRAL